MKIKYHNMLILIFLALGWVGLASAQVTLKHSTFGNGGTPIGDSQTRLMGTLGQTLIGTAENTTTQAHCGFWSLITDIGTHVEKIDNALPDAFRLYQNHPNPFNPTTVIRFSIPVETHVTVTLYDVLGRKTAVLVDEEKSPGVYHLTVDAGNLASGVYIYHMSAQGFSEIKKLMLIQ